MDFVHLNVLQIVVNVQNLISVIYVKMDINLIHQDYVLQSLDLLPEDPILKTPFDELPSFSSSATIGESDVLIYSGTVTF